MSALRRTVTYEPAIKKRRRSVSATSRSGPAKFMQMSKSNFYRGRISNGSIGPEIKNLDATVALTTVNTASSYVYDLLALLAEGTGAGNRVGQKVMVRSVDVKWNLTGTPGSAVTTSTVPVFMDVFLVLDKQPNGSTAAATTIFTAASTNLTGSNIIYLERFQVLRRARVAFDISSGLSEAIDWHVPLNLATRFSDSTSSPATNGLLLVALSPAATSLTTNIQPQVSYFARVKFLDL